MRQGIGGLVCFALEYQNGADNMVTDALAESPSTTTVRQFGP